MRPKATKGACGRCGVEYTKAAMAKHLAKCLIVKGSAIKGKSSPCFHLQVSTAYSSPYWLHLRVDANATLKSLDGFLRKIWLECCGHMSVFHINRREIGMGSKLASFLAPGMEIGYEYDKGDTTALRIKVMGQYPDVVAPKKSVAVLARNRMPEFPCEACGENPATQICQECQWDGTGWFCESCAAEHACDADYFMPVVNSPRTGVCGYTG